MTGEPFDRVIQSVYRAATGQESWEHALHLTADAVGAPFAQFIAVEKSTQRLALSLHSTNAPIDGVLDYMREYHKHDPHVAHGLTLKAGELFHTADLIAPAQARALPFYRDFWSVYDVRYALMGKVFEDESVIAMYAVLRSPSQTGFTQDDARTVRRTLGFLSEAFQLARRVNSLTVQAQVGQLVIDRIPRPCMLIDPNRLIVHCNADAQRLLARADMLVNRANYIACRDTRSDAVLLRELTALQLAATSADGSPERRAFALRDRLGRSVPACLWALRPATTLAAFGSTPLALLMLPTEGQATKVDPYVLEACFDLTPAEGRLLSLLAEGLDLTDATTELGIARATGRSHVRSIFAKTGVHSQADLLRKVDKLLSIA